MIQLAVANPDQPIESVIKKTARRQRRPSLAPIHVRPEHERRATAIQQELIDKYFPGLPPHEVWVLDGDIDVSASDGILKLGQRAVQSEDTMRFVIFHGLIHYASSDPDHGDRFLKLEAQMGLLGTTKDLACHAKGPITPFKESQRVLEHTALPQQSEGQTVQVGVPLENIAKRIKECFREYFLRVGNYHTAGRDQVRELSDLWNAYEITRNDGQSMVGLDIWKDCTDAKYEQEPKVPIKGEVSTGELLRAFDCSRTVIWRWQKMGFPQQIREGVFSLGSLLEFIERATDRKTGTLEQFASRQRICREMGVSTEVFDRWRRDPRFPKSVIQSRWSLPAVLAFLKTAKEQPKYRQQQPPGLIAPAFTPKPAIDHGIAQTIVEFFKIQQQQMGTLIESLQALGLRDFSDNRGYPEKPITHQPARDDPSDWFRNRQTLKARRENRLYESGVSLERIKAI